MQEIDTKLIQIIKEIADHFAMDMLQKWTRTIKRRKIVNTQQLLQSLDQETRADLGRVVVSVMFAFEEYGRMIDIKNKRWQYQPPVDSILMWVQKKGLAAFGPDPKPYKRKIKTDQQRMNEIAWGIAMQYKRNTQKDKPRPWFQSNLYKSLSALYEELSFGIQDRTVEQIKAALSQRIKSGATIKYY